VIFLKNIYVPPGAKGLIGTMSLDRLAEKNDRSFSLFCSFSSKVLRAITLNFYAACWVICLRIFLHYRCSTS